jgi:hypothetical protein
VFVDRDAAGNVVAAYFTRQRPGQEELPTQNARAMFEVDAQDRLLFELEFDQENRLRVLEGKAAVTKAQYRDALIARWKALNP